MKIYSVKQSNVDGLLKFRDELIDKCHSLENSDYEFKNVLIAQIKGIELSLTHLRIDFNKTEIKYIYKD